MRNSISIVFLLFISISCYEKVEFNVESRNFLVVDALIRPDKEGVVTINLLDEFNSRYEPVRDANVFVESIEGVVINLTHTQNGNYEFKQPLDVNQEYRINIDWNQIIYLSDFETFGSKMAQLKSLNFDLDRSFFFNATGNQELIEQIDISLNIASDERVFALFDYEGIYRVESVKKEGIAVANVCWFPDRSADFMNTISVRGEQNFSFLKIRPLSKFRSYNIFIDQYSISEKAYNYWRELQVIRSENGGIFSPPPSIVKGNITSSSNSALEVLGYFTLARYDSTRFSFQESMLPIELSDECFPVTDTLPDVCFDCSRRRDTLSVNNAPNFWVNP